jgi:hypothetical protein
MRLLRILAISAWVTIGITSIAFAEPMFMGPGDLPGLDLQSVARGVSDDGSPLRQDPCDRCDVFAVTLATAMRQSLGLRHVHFCGGIGLAAKRDHAGWVSSRGVKGRGRDRYAPTEAGACR